MATATLTALDPRRLRTTGQRVAVAAIVLGLLVVVLALVTGTRAQHRVWDGLPDCEGAATSDCVQVREGRFVVRPQKDGDAKVYFHPDGESGRDRISIDERHLRGSKATATALYLDGEPIGIQERDGDRRYRSGLLDVPAWYGLGLGAGAMLVIGGGFGLVRASRRRWERRAVGRQAGRSSASTMR